MSCYAVLRQQAASADLSPLRAPRPAPDSSPIDPNRVHLIGCAFLRFNCNYGDLIRWMEGPYTNAHRNWDDAFATFETVRNETPPPHFPNPDYERTLRACTEGVPLRAHYISSFKDCHRRNLKPPSADLLANTADVQETLRKEEKLSYHIALPRFLWRFFPGLFLSLFRVAYRYGDPKPRLCVDPSTKLHPNDTGNVNSRIPDPGVDEDQNPTIYYGTAFTRYLQWIWNLRISYPREDIIQSTDDISAAFHRVLYHPDMGPAFATVWKTWLIIPASAIFGSRSSPGNYMWKGELRAHFANFTRIGQAQLNETLIQRLQLPPPPSPHEIATFAQATKDSLNPGINLLADGTPERRMPSFVDDTGVAHVRGHFLQAAAASVHAAYVMFGHPSEDSLRPPCINPSKWRDEVSHILQFLGYSIDTRRMVVVWPLEKRQKFLNFVDAVLDDHAQRQCASPHSISRVLGLVRHAAVVAPMGISRSLALQHYFNDKLRTAPQGAVLRRWYQRRVIHVPNSIAAELKELRSKVSMEFYDPFWCRPIGLLVPREPTINVFTDASIDGLGGWSREEDLNHMWRVSMEDLVEAGIKADMGWNNNKNYHEPAIDPKGFHINVLEFISIIIELWICIRQLLLANPPRDGSRGPVQSHAPAETFPHGGHRLLARTDNTSALSWLRYAARTRRKPVRQLARLLTAFLCDPLISSLLRAQGIHIPGIANDPADGLSRYRKCPSWEAAMASSAPLQNLRICQFPLELLSLLVLIYSRELTEASFAAATTRLWTIDPPSFATGSQRPVGSHSSVVRGP